MERKKQNAESEADQRKNLKSSLRSEQEIEKQRIWNEVLQREADRINRSTD